MHPLLKAYESTAKAIELLLYPYAEVVLHDLKTQTIVAIFNNFSKRRVGGDSLLEEEFCEKIKYDSFPPYPKTNWDGRNLKSTTAVLRDEKGEPIGLLCINLDISSLEGIERAVRMFTQVVDAPKELFSDDWKEQIAAFVHQELRSKSLSLGALNSSDKQEIVRNLLDNGAFKAKHAADYVAQVLRISRATVYKYLKEK